MVRLLILCIRLYQAALSPLMGGCCRFSPSCSAYAREALERHGLRGLGLAARRLLRCRPFGPSGWDPVPVQSSRDAVLCPLPAARALPRQGDRP